ncbi:hypothetical protein [Arthrobacter globiformis]|uniref:hypothetical protein n=1 Tax=Arthrobacter globiformis TaxID=1665 RepID=UPI0027924104|nr:hypothetical protein [Arthrobacter globiformis]MDQ0618581.1 hypothetical protein [Arthrobacter globiformis]
MPCSDSSSPLLSHNWGSREHFLLAIARQSDGVDSGVLGMHEVAIREEIIGAG